MCGKTWSSSNACSICCWPNCSSSINCVFEVGDHIPISYILAVLGDFAAVARLRNLANSAVSGSSA